MTNTFARVKKIVVEILEVEPEMVVWEAEFVYHLNADSLDLINLIMQLEVEFGAEISDEEVDKIKTVGDAVDYIDEHAR